MTSLLVVLMAAFSVYAGLQISKAIFHQHNKRKAVLLLSIWAVIYALYLIYIVA